MPRLTVSAKLAIAIGIPLLLLLIIAVFSFVQFRHIESGLENIVEVEEPISAAAYEIEINTLGSGFAVLGYVHDRDPVHLKRMQKDFDDLRRAHQRFNELADTDQQHEQARQLDQLFGIYQQHAQRLVDDADTQAERFQQFGQALDEIDEILDERLQPSIKDDDPQALAKLRTTMELEVNANGIAKGV